MICLANISSPTACVVRWFVNGAVIAKTIEAQPPVLGDQFPLGESMHRVHAVFGVEASRFECANATAILAREAEPCA